MDASPLKRVFPRELLLMTLDELTPQLISIDCNMCLIAKCTCRDDTKTTREDLYRKLVENIQALSTLSRTCRELWRLVAPLLYACPLAPTIEGEWLLARTLAISPDLAQLVRILVPGHPGHPSQPFNRKLRAIPPPEVVAFCHGFAIASTIRPDANGVQTNRFQELELETRHPIMRYYRRLSSTMPVDLATILCPNLEQLCLPDHSWECLDPEVLWGNSTIFPKLKRVSINMDYEYVTSSGEGYMPFPRRTPNLESIHISKCEREPAIHGLVLHNLKFFELGGVGRGEEALNNALPMMPNIEQLIINYDLLYRGSPNDPIEPISLTPKTAAHYLVRKRAQASKLRNLTLNYMLPLDGWLSRCQDSYNWIVPLREVLPLLQRCRDELDEATQILAGLGIVLLCTIPTDADFRTACADNNPLIFSGSGLSLASILGGSVLGFKI